uniref:Uncharacterized protein n=1 Tax=Cairina moschata TaxID=8855 RepID=A0A8C3GNR8_CAIMO
RFNTQPNESGRRVSAVLAVPAAEEQRGAQPLLNKSCQRSGRDLTPSRCQYVARPLPSPGKWIWKTHQALGAALPEHFLREDPK